MFIRWEPCSDLIYRVVIYLFAIATKPNGTPVRGKVQGKPDPIGMKLREDDKAEFP
jgi:hypothetical protein